LIRKQNLTGGTLVTIESLWKSMFGDEELALAAYNWGMGNVDKKLKELERKGRQQTLGEYSKAFRSAFGNRIDYVRRSACGEEKKLHKIRQGFGLGT
jgi:hypothetical protein